MSTTSFRLDDERRLRMLQETEDAVADIEARRVVSGEEVMEWLATWGTTAETEAPRV